MSTSQNSHIGVEKLRSVPGNNVCVDCKAPDPEWASINLGILMCLECSGVHRSLGTHISKVRSLDLDVECWQGELLQFMCSVGNAAFNRVWEGGNAAIGAIRPQDYPGVPFIRRHFITRKYQLKSFMVVPRASSVSGALNGEGSVVKSGIVSKLGGKDTALFHAWQRRNLTIREDGIITYSKTPDSPILGSIDLKVPGQEFPLLETSSTDSGSGFVFSIPTPLEGEHRGRKFLFRCETEVERLQFVEAIRGEIARHTLPTCISEPGPIGSRVEECTPLEEDVASMLASFLSGAILREDGQSADAIDETAAACLKKGRLLFKHPSTRIWTERLCVLTKDAFYISHASQLPLPPSSATESGCHVTEVEQPIATVIPLKTVYIDKHQPNFSTDENPPRDSFAVWGPLAYALLGVTVGENEKDDWIAAIAAASEALKETERAITS